MTSRIAQGYAMAATAYLFIGLSGTLVTWATAPASLLLTLRFAVAALLLGAVFARKRRVAGLFVPGVWPRLLAMGVLDAGAVLLYVAAIRETSVAIATFLLFIQPVWVALLAPRLLGSATEGTVYASIGLALAGLVIILVPAFSGNGVHASALGLLAGFGFGLSYAGFTLLVKGLTRRVDSGALVPAECTLDGLLHTGCGARVRANSAGPDRLGLDGCRRRPHPGRRHIGCAARTSGTGVGAAGVSCGGSRQCKGRHDIEQGDFG